jgi:hypothetical protein
MFIKSFFLFSCLSFLLLTSCGSNSSGSGKNSSAGNNITNVAPTMDLRAGYVFQYTTDISIDKDIFSIRSNTGTLTKEGTPIFSGDFDESFSNSLATGLPQKGVARLAWYPSINKYVLISQWCCTVTNVYVFCPLDPQSSFLVGEVWLYKTITGGIDGYEEIWKNHRYGFPLMMKYSYLAPLGSSGYKTTSWNSRSFNTGEQRPATEDAQGYDNAVKDMFSRI